MAQISECCLTGFNWDGKPIGREYTLANIKCYVTGQNPDAAILMISDMYGWRFRNNRILADHFAREAEATVYLPDFFDGEVIPENLLDQERWSEIDLAGWASRNSKEARWPTILACVEALRSSVIGGYKRVGAIGHCYGGWAAVQLAAPRSSDISGNTANAPLVDCIAVAHPSWLTKEEIDKIGSIPVQIIAPEHDPAFTLELKAYANEVLIKKGVPYDYQYFPEVAHGFSTRGNPKNERERRAMARAKNAMVVWMGEWLHGEPW